MTAMEVFKQFYSKLVTTLPMDDEIFIAELYSKSLLDHEMKLKIEVELTRSKKAVQFLDKCIYPNFDSGGYWKFDELLNVMEDSEDLKVKKLARAIKVGLRKTGPGKRPRKENASVTTSESSESLDDDLAQFKAPHLAYCRPLLKDLQKYFIPLYATKWKVIGTLLGLDSHNLVDIQADHPSDAKLCCREMFKTWLEADSSATWEKLNTILDSHSVCSGQAGSKGYDEAQILSKNVKARYVQRRNMATENTWPPPNCHNTFVPTVLLQKDSQYITKLKNDSNISELQEGHMTKRLEEIFDLDRVNSSMILVEGAPGIGKTILAKEIAYRWATGCLLRSFVLVLLIFLRDPLVHKMVLVTDVFKIFCIGDVRTEEIVLACNSYFLHNNGKNLAFILDGYDELPDSFQKNSLIAELLNRLILPECTIIVTSRPRVSLDLHYKANMTVEILGFTEEGQNQYIHQAFPGQKQKIVELLDYCKQNSYIGSLCTIPLNMVILLFLYKQKIPLPSNVFILYQYFICLIICRHLVKSGQPLPSNANINLSTLPEPCSKVVWLLGKLALEGLNSNKSVFTFDEVEHICPVYEKFPNYFGLLQVIQSCTLTGVTITFHFLHQSFQEFFAAYYVANLSADEELMILEKNFWSDFHCNMFVIYIACTEGQSLSFKHFLSDGNKSITISHQFLQDPIKCIRLYHYFYKAGCSDKFQFTYNETCFAHKVIVLNNIKLLPFDVEGLALFLVHSAECHWESVCLENCKIQDQGVKNIFSKLRKSSIVIKKLDLSANGLTSASLQWAENVIIGCEMKELRIGTNFLGKQSRVFCSILSSASNLQLLDVESNSISSQTAIDILNSLKCNSTLLKLYMQKNNIADDACGAIVDALKINKTLQVLYLNGNLISESAAHCIVNSLACNHTLVELQLSLYSDDAVKKLITIKENVNSVVNIAFK